MEIIWKNFEDTDYIVSNTGIIINTRTDKTINQFPGGTGGYMMVNIWHNKTNRIIAVHRVVAETFIPNPLNKRTVNHIDGNKLNNFINNLEWSTYSENLKHAVDTGLNHRGMAKPNVKLTDDKVIEIRKLFLNGAANSVIAKLYNVADGTISQIRNGSTWKHVQLIDSN